MTSFQQSRTLAITALLCTCAALFAFASSQEIAGGDSLLPEDGKGSWISEIRALVRRQADAGLDEPMSPTTPPLTPIDDENTTTTKKPKKKKKNKDKKKKDKKNKNKNKNTTPAPMTTLLPEQDDFNIMELADLPLGENITMNAYDETTLLYEKYNGTIKFNFTNLLAPVIMTFESDDENVFRIVSDNEIIFNPNDPSHNGTVEVTVLGWKLGIAKLIVRVTDLNENDIFNDKEDEVASQMTYTMKTRRVPRLIDVIFDFLLLPLILVTTAGMGCKMDFMIIRDKLKKPLQILVGPVCQFICQPFYAFSISKILKLSGITAVGLVTVGSCPGGGVSNMITLLLDADLILSVTMTFTSTCLAVAMLPINMLIYARHFLKEEGGDGGVNIPFLNIIIQIMMLTIPILIGMFIHYKLPKVAYYAIKSLNVLSLTMVSTTLIIGVYSNLYIFESEWNVFVGALLLPTCGYTTGFLISKFIARFPMESALTIMVETGVQNNLIAISMIKLSYPQPEADLMARMPIFVATFSIIIGLVMIGCSIPINRRRRNERKQHAAEIKDVDDKYDQYEFEPTVRNGTASPKALSNGNGHFPTTPTGNSEVPPSYEEAQPFITNEKLAKETIV